MVEDNAPPPPTEHRQLEEEAYRRRKAEGESRRWTCECPSTGKQIAIAVVVTAAEAFVLAAITSSDSSDLIGRAFGFWTITGVGGFVLYKFARSDEQWFLVGRHIEGPTIPRRIRRILWEAKRRAGVNPGPEPLDVKGIAKVIAMMLMATLLGIIPVVVGILLTRTRLGAWGFPLGVVGGAAAVFVVGWCAGSVRARRRSVGPSREETPYGVQ